MSKPVSIVGIHGSDHLTDQLYVIRSLVALLENLISSIRSRNLDFTEDGKDGLVCLLNLIYEGIKELDEVSEK